MTTPSTSEGVTIFISVGEVMAFDSFGRAPQVFHGGTFGRLMKRRRVAWFLLGPTGRSVTELSRLVVFTGHRVGDEHFRHPRRTH